MIIRSWSVQRVAWVRFGAYPVVRQSTIDDEICPLSGCWWERATARSGCERRLNYSSQHGHAAVHEQQGAGDVGGIVGGQKQDRGGDLLGPARALQPGDLGGPGVVLLDGLAGSGDAALMGRREEWARADGVHTNALRRVVGGERPRQARDRGLGGVVLQVAATCDDGTHGGDVDDRAALVAAHQRNRRLGTQDVAHQVDVEDLFPARRARLVDLLVFANAGIVDEDVEPPELLRGAVDEVEAW